MATPLAAGDQGTSVTKQPQHSQGVPHHGRGPASVEDMLRLMIEDRTRREEELAEERRRRYEEFEEEGRRQREENEKRMAEMQEQM